MEAHEELDSIGVKIVIMCVPSTTKAIIDNFIENTTATDDIGIEKNEVTAECGAEAGDCASCGGHVIWV